jgi:hypothetical protein
MPALSLSGSLPADDRNGLASIVRQLVSDPEDVHVAIVLLDTKKITTDVETGDVVPTARVRAIEPISGTEDGKELERLLRRAYERRTGQRELPLELERELDFLNDITGDE